MVLNQAVESLPLADANGRAWDPSLLPLIVQLAPQSPMEIQINNDLWIPAKIDAKCSVPDHDNMQPCQGGCNWNCTTNTKTAGWDVVSVPIPDSISANITAIRYAWGGNPCCPTVNRQIIPCPPNSCPIQTFNTTMPAVCNVRTINAHSHTHTHTHTHTHMSNTQIQHPTHKHTNTGAFLGHNQGWEVCMDVDSELVESVNESMNEQIFYGLCSNYFPILP